MTNKSTLSNVPSSAFRLFFKEMGESQAKRKKEDDKISQKIRAKTELLRPIESLLRGLSVLGIQLSGGREFAFYKKESSPSWAPGISLLFDFPSLVEIAIPNTQDEGAVVVRVVSEHDPHAHLLNKKFESILQATESLAKYLGRHSLSLEMDPRADGLEKLQSKELLKKQENINQLNQMAKTLGAESAKHMESPIDRDSKPLSSDVLPLLQVLEGEQL